MKQYSIILADPPWSFGTWGKTRRSPRGGERYYPTMTTAEIAALPVADLAADDAVLFMWAVWPSLPDALQVIEAWGFTYKTAAFVWMKQNKSGWGLYMGMGYWTRANTEMCLLATRGNPRRVDRGVRQTVLAPLREHSRKPDEVHERIVRLMGDLPRVELFARRPHEGWDVWGDEVASDIEMELTA